MPSSAVLLAKRALVTLMRSLATTYQIGVGIHRDAQDDAVMSTFRQLARHTHPDRGGETVHQQQLRPEGASARPSPEKCHCGVMKVRSRA